MNLRRVLEVLRGSSAPTSPSSRFWANFVRVGRANVFALLLPLVATPILSRLFLPEDYGLLAMFTSVLAVLLAFCTWRFDWSIPNARTNTVAASLFCLGAVILIAICGLSIVAIIVGSTVPWPSGSLFVKLGALVWFMPLALLGGGLRLLLSGWFVRQGDLSAVGRATIAQSIANVSLSLGAGAARLGAFGLLCAFVISGWAGLRTLFRQANTSLRRHGKRVTRRSIITGWRLHVGNASWSSAVAVLNALSLSGPVLILAHYYSPQEVGWYALMYRLVAAPTGALASALGQSFWSLAADYARSRRYQELAKAYRRTTGKLALATMPVILGCLAGPMVMGGLLGDSWANAGHVLVAMIPLFVGSIVFSPTNHLVVFDKQPVQLLVDGLRFILILGSVGLAKALGYTFVAAVFLVSTSSLLAHLLLYLVHRRIHVAHER